MNQKMVAKQPNEAGQFIRALSLSQRAYRTSPLATMYIAGILYDIEYIPSLSFIYNKECHFSKDTDLLMLFNSTFILPKHKYWKLFRLTSAIAAQITEKKSKSFTNGHVMNDTKYRDTVCRHRYSYMRPFEIDPHLDEQKVSWDWMCFLITWFSAEVRAGNYGFGRDIKVLTVFRDVLDII